MHRIEAHLYDVRGTARIAAVFYGTNEMQAAVEAKHVTNSRRLGRLPLPSGATAGPVFAAHYPLTVDKCLEMRQVWGDLVKVHSDLGNWYRAALAERQHVVNQTAQADAELTRVPALYPELNAYLKGDQRVTAAWIASAYRGGGLLADEVGTGKTVGVVAGLVEAGIRGNVLIVCPKLSVRGVWLREIRKHTDIPVYACYGTRSRREKTISAYLADTSDVKVLVVVAEMVRVKCVKERNRITEILGYEYPELFDLEWNAVVVDESHKVLGSMDVVKGNLIGEGMRRLNFSEGRLKLAVSATPFGKGGRIEAMFGTLHWLWPDEYTSRWGWLNRYFEITEDRVFVKGGGGATQTVRRVGGLRNGISEGQFWQELGPRVLRRTMEEVSPDHRGLKNWYTMACEMAPAQERQYKRFTEDAELVVPGGIVSTVGTLDYLTRARQFANGVLRMEGGRVVYTGESSKIDKLLAHLDLVGPDRKMVIASQWNEYLDVVEQALADNGYGCYRLDGKTSETTRERIMAEFQGEHPAPRTSYSGRVPGSKNVINKCPGCGVKIREWHSKACPQAQTTAHNIFLLNSSAGGVSITLDSADELHQLDRMFPPEANTQLYGRIFRRGRAHEVFYYLYESMGTIDEQITEKTEAGHADQMRLLDGRRGKEYVRNLAQYRTEEG